MSPVSSAQCRAAGGRSPGQAPRLLALAALASSSALGLAAATDGRGPIGRGALIRRERVTRSRLQVAIERVLSGEAAKRLFSVEASIRPSFEALPKNAMGHIPPEDVFPSIVRSYFSKEHGWIIKGFEPPTLPGERTSVHGASILRDRAPAVAEALDAMRRSDQGLAVSDVIGTIAVLEHLVIEESVRLLSRAYELNGLKKEAMTTEGQLLEVLMSYLLIYRYGADDDLSQADHDSLKRSARETSDWQPMLDFALGALHATAAERSADFSFSAAADIVRDMVQKYGAWQNLECEDMKAALLRLSSGGGGAPGAVPFGAFHGEPQHDTFQFSEDEEYLEKIGVLQKDGNASQVRIANYLLGPTNCIATSRYYTVCCLSECEVVISDIETKTQSPIMGPEALIGVIEAISSSTVAAPRTLPEAVADSLRNLGEVGEGAVALHSAGFKQWLHRAFPSECPEPTMSEAAAEEAELETSSRWMLAEAQCSRLPSWHPLRELEV